MKMTVLALFLSGTILLSGCGKKDEESVEVVSLRREIAKEPQNWKLWFELAERFEKEELYQKGIEALQAILEANEAEGRVQAKLAELHLKNKEMDAALATAEKILQQNPASGIGYEVLGSLHFARGDYEQARTFLTQANQLGNWEEETTLTILYNLAVCHSKLRGEEKAKEIFAKIMEKDPFHEATLLSVALDHFRRQEWPQAEISLKKLISKEPDNYQHYLVLGLLYYHQSSWTLCQENLRKAFDLDTAAGYLARIADVANLHEIPENWDLALVVHYQAKEAKQYREKGEYIVRGEAINIGFRIAKKVRVNVTYYDDKYNQIYDETFYFKPENVMPMQIQEFRVAIPDDPAIKQAKVEFNWQKSSLQYQGRRY